MVVSIYSGGVYAMDPAIATVFEVSSHLMVSLVGSLKQRMTFNV
jgi:hypothetical protein